MKNISSYNNKASAKTFIIFFVFAAFTVSPNLLNANPKRKNPSSGGESKPANTSQNSAKPATDRSTMNNDSNGTSNGGSVPQITLSTGAPPDRCLEARRDLRSSQNKISEACKKAGMGDMKSCLDKSLKCGETAGEEAFPSTASLLAQLSGDPGVLAAANSFSNSGANSICPQMSGRDYFSEKEKIMRDIDTTKEDLSKLNDDKAKVEEDFNREIADLQEQLDKAQQELEKTKLEIKEKKRKQLADFQNQQNQTKEELRKKGTEVLTLRGQLVKSQQDHALQLIAMTDASGKRACMKSVAEAKKAYEAVSANASSNYISSAKKKKQDLINLYNDCIDSFTQQRNALNQSKRQEQEQLNKAINDTQTTIEEMNNSINSASSQLAEMQADAKAEEDNATQKVTKLMQVTQQKMLAAQQKMQTKLQTLAAKQNNLSQKLNRLNNSLMTLGPAPKSKGSDYSPAEASSDISSAVNDALAIMNEPMLADCVKGYTENKVMFDNYKKGVQ